MARPSQFASHSPFDCPAQTAPRGHGPLPFNGYSLTSWHVVSKSNGAFVRVSAVLAECCKGRLLVGIVTQFAHAAQVCFPSLMTASRDSRRQGKKLRNDRVADFAAVALPGVCRSSNPSQMRHAYRYVLADVARPVIQSQSEARNSNHSFAAVRIDYRGADRTTLCRCDNDLPHSPSPCSAPIIAKNMGRVLCLR